MIFKIIKFLLKKWVSIPCFNKFNNELNNYRFKLILSKFHRCDGNANNFKSEKECMSSCSGV